MERPDEQEDNKSGAWECRIGYTQKKSVGQKGLKFWEVELLFCGQLGAMDIFKQVRDRA